MAYQIADMNNGPFSDEVETIEEAEALLSKYIKEGKRLNMEENPDGSELGTDGTTVESFFYIVESETGEDI